MKQLGYLVSFVAVLALSAPAVAQPVDDFDDAEDEELFDTAEEEPADTGAEPAAAQPAEEPAAAPAPAGGTDHDQTVGAWGFQVTAADSTGLPIGDPMAAPPTLPMLGVRKWDSRDSGWEAGGTLVFVNNGAADTTDIVFGGTFGILRTLGVYQHMSVFWEPQGTVLVHIPDDAVSDDVAFAVEGLFNIGSEVRLGVVGLPRIGMTVKLGAGLRVASVGGDTNIFAGTVGGLNNSVEGLLDGTIGFVFYQ